ncbi:SIR2 family protein [Morganella morganii]
MHIDFSDEKALLRRIKNSDHVSFIFGSALSAKYDDIGIPNVNEMTQMAIDYINESGQEDIDDYNLFMANNNSDNKYQETFHFIINNYGIDIANQIIKQAILSNVDKLTSEHKVTKPINDLAEKIKDNTLIVDHIITTNFDTLIEEGFKQKGIPFNGISIVSDSNINENNNNLPNIIHIHGSWDRSDTMHTKSQLNNNREKIESSLKRILNKNIIIVIGYGGWEDSFMRSISGVLNDDKAKYSILWCFYESDELKIKSNTLFFSSLKDAISRGRITFYKGIDCHTFFEKLKKKTGLIKI